MSWNHRVMKTKDGPDDFYEIHEVYYDKAGKPTAYTTHGVGPAGATLEELSRELELFKAALAKPVLSAADFDACEAQARQNGNDSE